MAEVVLFHHAQGLTQGVVAFADELCRAGHTVHTPDHCKVETSTPPGRWWPTQRTPSCSCIRPNQHLFTDASLPSYDPEATALLTQRVLDFLQRT